MENILVLNLIRPIGTLYCRKVWGTVVFFSQCPAIYPVRLYFLKKFFISRNPAYMCGLLFVLPLNEKKKKKEVSR